MIETEAEGWAEALRRIARCRETRDEALDLSGLMLRELPVEVYALDWLRALDLGIDREATKRPNYGITEYNQGKGRNALAAVPERLAGLVNLTSLDLSDNRIGPDGARALAGLVNLTTLNLWDNQIGPDGARALAGLANLTSLNLWGNQIGADGARALAGLVNLTNLDLTGNRIGDDGARALAGLVNLTTLDLAGNRIGDDGARALAGLVNLTTLNLWGNGPLDATPLYGLRHLKELNASRCAFPDGFDLRQLSFRLEELILHETAIPGIPAEVLSTNDYGDNCLDRLVSHLDDLDAGAAEITDVKFMILGNGRVGKTQIVRRLEKPGVDTFDETVKSTHGVQVTSAMVPGTVGCGSEAYRTASPRANIGAVRAGALPHPTAGPTEQRGATVSDPEGLTPKTPNITLRIWDFGGQDIYHGTHALFLKSRAIFPLVWTPASEQQMEHEHGGFTFRNQPLAYWLAYVKALGGRDSPVIVIQSQCDDQNQKADLPATARAALADIKPNWEVQYSARTDHGRGALDGAIFEAAHWVRQTQGVGRTGIGRLAVKTRLEAMAAAGARMLAWGDYLTLCEQVQAEGHGTISSPRHLVEYLHDIGTVFYRQGLFGDNLILDQGWALEKVYAVFDREQASFRRIERNGGRFTRADLAETVWKENTRDEQELFLSFMQQCSISFELRDPARGRDEAPEYIAPDLLPKNTELAKPGDAVGTLVQADKWDADRPTETATLAYDFLTPGLLRGLMAKIGAAAGRAGTYWRDGFHFFDQKTGARALVEQRWVNDWAGEIAIRTQKGEAATLRDRLVQMIEEDRVGFGAKPAAKTISGQTEAAGESRAPRERERAEVVPSFERSEAAAYFVSYKWGAAEDMEREKVVDDLCAAAEAAGKKIVRDKTDLRNGELISEFIERIGQGVLDGRVCIVLSDAYLKSPNCMTELHAVWRNCRGDKREFISRTRVFVLPSARIGDEADRMPYAAYWRERFKKMQAQVELLGAENMSVRGFADWKLMERFALETPEILQLVQDTLTPRDFEAFKAYLFEA